MIRICASVTLSLVLLVVPKPLSGQSPVPRAVTQHNSKVPLWRRILRVSGITSNPTTLRAPDPVSSGQIYITEIAVPRTRRLASGGGYSSPVFVQGGNAVLVFKGQYIMSVPLNGGMAKLLRRKHDITKLIGFSQDDPDKMLVLLAGRSRLPTIGWLSMKSGSVTIIPYDTTSNDDRRMVEYLQSSDRRFGNTVVYVDTQIKGSLSGKKQWTDAFVKTGSGNATNATSCNGVNCGQPSLSPDGRFLVFIKAGE